MLDIFTQTYQARGAVSQAPGIDNFRRKIKDNVRRMQEYYASNVRSVPSNHPLVQALKHSGVYTMDAVELFNVASERSPYISKNFGFTTEFNRGFFNKHKVYPSRDNMIYSSSQYTRPYEAVQAWSQLRPVNLLWMDSDYLDMSVPSHLLNTTDSFSSISVDIPLMALMYKGFKEYYNTTTLVLGEDQFVATYLLPSMLESQVDMSMVSALISVYEGDYRHTSRVNSNFYLPSYSTEYEAVARHVLNRISDTRMQYKDILQNIPCVYQENALQTLTLPDFISTTQVDWAMMATRFKIINFLLDVGGTQGRKANQGFINKLKVYSRLVINSGVPYGSMSNELASSLQSSLDKYMSI